MIDAPTVSATYEAMRQKLSKLVPDLELRVKAEIAFEIQQLKKEKGAIILGHNYMEPALFHTVCDITGDSLYLSREAQKSKAETIIFCGVRFMAETAKILNPSRTILLPAKKAGCSLASSISAEEVRKLKALYPGLPVITYINTYADVKAETDICVTSGNADKVIRSFKDQAIIFLPDHFMAQNLAREVGKPILLLDSADGPAQPVPTNGIIGWRGKCEVHEQFTVQDIDNVRAQFPGVAVITHPECPPEVVQAADYSAGTTHMVNYVRASKAPHFLILTECSMADNIIAENPDRDILRLCSIRCPHMHEITLEDTLECLKQNQYQIEVEESIRLRAHKAVARMLEF